MNGRIVRCGIISSCQLAATSEIVAYSASGRESDSCIRSAIAGIRPLHLLYPYLTKPTFVHQLSMDDKPTSHSQCVSRHASSGV